MKVLQINASESPGRRFNGLAITPLLKDYGIDSKHLIWQKDTRNPEVLTFTGLTKKITKVLNKVENHLSLQSILYPTVSQIIKIDAFKEADLIHLHVIHSGYLSIRDLHKITNLKPTVWTLHDPWAMTGHCIHPLECDRWQVGCGNCPDLKRPIPLRFDTTRFLFNYKKKAYKKANFNLIVASKWMQKMVEKSPIFDNPKVHRLPFGVDLNFFSPKHTKAARKRFNIPDDNIVISFRANIHNPFKGVSYIIEALELIKTDKPICIITVNSFAQTIFLRFKHRFRVIEFEWFNDETLIRDIMAASDIFLMPSIAESFGLMAIEAFACGKSTIVFEGTALSDLTFAPEVGIAVPRDAVALSSALQNLIENDDERAIRGGKSREIAELHYNINTHVKNLVQIYISSIKGQNVLSKSLHNNSGI